MRKDHNLFLLLDLGAVRLVGDQEDNGEECRMDWEAWAMGWGPAIPFAAILAKGFSHLVYQVIPNGFASLQKILEDAEKKAEKRHEEHMRLMQSMSLAIVNGACKRDKLP